MPFRYWGKDHIDMYTRFLINDKHDIEKINDYLCGKYSCVSNGECNGWMAFEKRIMPEIKPMAEIETMDMNSFLESFETVFRYVFDYFSIPVERYI